MDICLKVFVLTHIFISLEWIPGCLWAEFLGCVVSSIFSFFRDCQALFQSGHIILYSCQQCMRWHHVFYLQKWPLWMMCCFFLNYWPCCVAWSNLSSLARDGTAPPCRGSMESSPLNHQGSPWRMYVLTSLKCDGEIKSTWKRASLHCL